MKPLEAQFDLIKVDDTFNDQNENQWSKKPIATINISTLIYWDKYTLKVKHYTPNISDTIRSLEMLKVLKSKLS